MASVLLFKRVSSVLKTCQRICNSSYGAKQDINDLVAMSPKDFLKYMKKVKLNRCFVVYNNDVLKPVSSHQVFDQLSEFCRKDRYDYRRHEGMFLQIGQRTGVLMGVFLWRTNRGQSFGDVKIRDYDTMEEYIRDGLQRSYSMGIKSALAGVWIGGGNSVVASPGLEKIIDKSFRTNMFLDYGEMLSSLNGCYIAAGLDVEDTNNVYSKTRFITSVSEDKNLSNKVGEGVVCAMESALDYVKMGDLSGKRVVSQGCGNVAQAIISHLLDKNVEHIFASDCNEQALELTEKLFADKCNRRLTLEHVNVGDTLTLTKPCDILSPNAHGRVLTTDTIPGITTKIVCGAACNQLGKIADNKLLEDKGITYIVDFITNRMDIVGFANEAYGSLNNDPQLQRHFNREWKNSIWNVVQNVLQFSETRGITSVEAAIKIAERESRKLHQIYPHRNHQIISELVENNWAGI